MTAIASIPTRRWYWPGVARKPHLFSFHEGQRQARSLCSKHTINVPRLVAQGRVDPPEYGACLTCLKQLALAGVRLGGER